MLARGEVYWTTWSLSFERSCCSERQLPKNNGESAIVGSLSGARHRLSLARLDAAVSAAAQFVYRDCAPAIMVPGGKTRW
jgi:hypothetical protein